MPLQLVGLGAQHSFSPGECSHCRFQIRFIAIAFFCRFFGKVTFQVSRERSAENAFYLDSVALFCNTIEICFNPQTLFGAQQTAEILQK